MGALEFQWEALPTGLRDVLGAEAQIGVPDPEWARDHWILVRDSWLLGDGTRTSRFAAMLDALDVGRAARAGSGTDAEFITSVRNAPGLRHALARYVIALGSPPGPADDPVEQAAAPDRIPAPASQPAADATIPSPDFAPQSHADFNRLSGINDLMWSLWSLQVFNTVEQLLPGESFVVRSLVEDVANDGQSQGGFGLSFAHAPGDVLVMVAMPESLLPVGVTYEPMWSALADLDWQRQPTGQLFLELPWPDGIDDAVAIAVQTLRSVFMIDSPTRLEQSEEARPPDGLLPAPPAPSDVIEPDSTWELLSVVGSIIRHGGGTVLTGADETTHAFRLGPWTGWIHADTTEPILDAVVVVTDLARPEGQSFDTARVLEVQAGGLRFGRLVVTETQALVAGSMPCHAFNGRAVEVFITGLIRDAARAIGLAEPSTPLTPGLGGYL